MESARLKENDGSRFASATGEAGVRRNRFCRSNAEAKLEGPRDLEAAFSLSPQLRISEDRVCLLGHQFRRGIQISRRRKGGRDQTLSDWSGDRGR
jgi:hypothetical protein